MAAALAGGVRAAGNEAELIRLTEYVKYRIDTERPNAVWGDRPRDAAKN